MPMSLRIPPEKMELIRKAARRAGKTRSAFLLEAVDEKLGLSVSRQDTIRRMAGWLSHEEAEELRESLAILGEVHAGDWA
ncbi:MAG: DUF1778 domain-containing protein [Candidatus Riflebacteria bacterium]|nr:DUF1778 domain-containing protein [Candidatus Riflebacteria bacterium]